MRYHAITLLFLILALAAYARGLAGAGLVFLVIGVLAEGVFWLRLVRGRKSGPST